jgi:DNA-binding beta-propeller fold protein YncE
MIGSSKVHQRQSRIHGVMVLAFMLLVSTWPSFAAVASAQAWPEGSRYEQIGAPALYSYGIALADGDVWVVDNEAGCLYRLAKETGESFGSIAIGGQLTGICYDGSQIWVASNTMDSLLAIQPATGKILREIPSPGTSPAGLAWDGEALWNVDRRTQAIYRIDPLTGDVLHILDAVVAPDDHVLETPRSPRGLMWHAGGLYLVDSLRRRIYQIDPQSGEVASQITTPTPYPRGVATDGKEVFYSDRDLGVHRLWIRRLPGTTTIASNPTDWRIVYMLTRTNEGTKVARNLRIYIGIPQTMDHQHVLNVSLDPNPTQYVFDDFGQKVAVFGFGDVAPGQSVTIRAEYEARLWNINHNIVPSQVGPLQGIPRAVRALYTIDGEKYGISDLIVSTAMNEAVGGEDNPYYAAVRIHDYVATHITYGSGASGWAAAPMVLQEKEGSCSEYTFSVIALARAAGLPARYQGGTAPRSDGIDTDGHRWAEVYIPDHGWLPLDATRDEDEGEAMHWYVGSRPVMLTLVCGGGTDDLLYHTYRDWGKWSGSGADMNRDWQFLWEPLGSCSGSDQVIQELMPSSYRILVGSSTDTLHTFLRIGDWPFLQDVDCVSVAIDISLNGEALRVYDTFNVQSGIVSKDIKLGGVADLIRVNRVEIRYWQ